MSSPCVGIDVGRCGEECIRALHHAKRGSLKRKRLPFNGFCPDIWCDAPCGESPICHSSEGTLRRVNPSGLAHFGASPLETLRPSFDCGQKSTALRPHPASPKYDTK